MTELTRLCRLMFKLALLVAAIQGGSTALSSSIEIIISESDFAHGTNLTFDVAEVKLLRFRSPMISQITVPEYLLLPRTRLPVSFEVMGTNSVKPGSHEVVARLTDGNGHVLTQQKQDLAGQRVAVLDTSSILSGQYRLHLNISEANGKLCSEETRDMEAIIGPSSDTR